MHKMIQEHSWLQNAKFKYLVLKSTAHKEWDKLARNSSSANCHLRNNKAQVTK